MHSGALLTAWFNRLPTSNTQQITRAHHMKLQQNFSTQCINNLTPRSNLKFSLLSIIKFLCLFRQFSIGSTNYPQIDFVFILITDLFNWYCKEKFCLGHSWELKGQRVEWDVYTKTPILFMLCYVFHRVYITAACNKYS